MVMTQDPELAAIGVITDALGQLEDEQARTRVLRYANERFGIVGQGPHRTQHMPPVSEQSGGTQRARAEVAEPDFAVFVDLFDAVNPATDVDRALVAGYWLQCCRNQSSWGGQEANNLLKDMGHGIRNITTATTSAQRHKPALIRQVSKTGKAQQARKSYKLTTAGVERVRNMIGLAGAVPAALADNGEEQSA
jgi:hypothetical protein